MKFEKTNGNDMSGKLLFIGIIMFMAVFLTAEFTKAYSI